MYLISGGAPRSVASTSLAVDRPERTYEREEPPPKILADLGTAIRGRRRELGLAQDVCAERAGVNRTYLSDVEAGKRNVSLLNIEKIARALDLEPWQLLKLAREKP